MDALTLLTEQHDEMDELFARIEAADDIATKCELFEELADKLAAHSKIEETQFYPAIMSSQTKDMILESTEEHLQIKRVLADLLELDPEDDHFDAKLEVMKEEIEHHARKEEEGELFPKVKQLLGAAQLEALGTEMEAQYIDLLGEAPRHSVPAETDRAARIAS